MNQPNSHILLSKKSAAVILLTVLFALSGFGIGSPHHHDANGPDKCVICISFLSHVVPLTETVADQQLFSTPLSTGSRTQRKPVMQPFEKTAFPSHAPPRIL